MGAGSASYGALAWVGSIPADGEVQVATTSDIRVQFGSRVLLESLRRADTRLLADGDAEPVPGSWSLSEDGSTGVFRPSAPLQPETDYTLCVSPLTCDADARILEVPAVVHFRTVDATPPAVVACSVTPGETGRSRTSPITITWSEAPLATSVRAEWIRLTDQFGGAHALELLLDESTITATPSADLPGDRWFTFTVDAAVTDRAGNPMGADWAVAFRTTLDTTAPRALSIWPTSNSSGMSPRIEPTVRFDESMDPASIEPSSVLFQDEFGGIVPFHAESSADQRTLRICPDDQLAQGRRYTLAFLVSGAAITDVSGNALSQTLLSSFTVGMDATAPSVAAAEPSDLATHVSPNVAPRVVFTEGLDSTSVHETTVRLLADGEEVPCVLSMPNASTIQLQPVLHLPTQTLLSLVISGGASGIRDQAGNTLESDVSFSFTTSQDPALPTATLQPSDGAVGVPPSMRASIVFASPLDPTSVSTLSAELRTDAGQSIPTSVTLSGANRVVGIRPLVPLQPNAYYRTYLRGGPSGLRSASGNWMSQDLGARYRIGSADDFSPPVVQATLNGIDASRREGLVLPQQGFTVQVDAVDGMQTPDMGSVRVDFVGPGAPASDALWTVGTVGYRSFRALVPSSAALTPGAWTMTVRVGDLSGNVGVSAPIAFTVAEPTGGLVPFERTQVVWARTDLDRDSNGRADFEDDMLRLGLASASGPSAVNAFVRDLARDAILAHAHSLFGRASDGSPIDADSVGVRFTPSSPAGLPHMQIALGGFDPRGERERSYGSATTGVLGRAYYDYRNANINDRNTSNSPGLGVFPSEMFLYQADLHEQLYPSFLTMFAQRFMPLCPDMGGTPVGSSPIDAQIFQPSFDLATANSEQLARSNTVRRAITDWAKVIGTVLAHETGHAVGLVAPGPAPSGLFGDSSLHNANASAAEVMAAAVGYEAMVSLTYAFRDTDAAYLRHRILVR